MYDPPIEILTAFYLSENEPIKGPNNKPNMGLATQIHDVPLKSSTMVPRPIKFYKSFKKYYLTI